MGLCCAYFLAQKGFRVQLFERNAELGDSCALGSAGFVSPSHFVPLATPGMVALGLRWMLDSSGPFYMKPRLDGDFLQWGWLFWQELPRAPVLSLF